MSRRIAPRSFPEFDRDHVQAASRIAAVGAGFPVRLTRLVTVLMASVLALLALALALSLMTIAAATGVAPYDTLRLPLHDEPSAAHGPAHAHHLHRRRLRCRRARRIGLALRQWNRVLNGFVRLAVDARRGLRRRHRAASPPALGSWPRWTAVIRRTRPQRPRRDRRPRGSSFVYVIADRFAVRDLTAVMLHEFGHLLGAGHDPNGHLIAPVYGATTATASIAPPWRWSRRRGACPSTSSTGQLGSGLDGGRTSYRGHSLIAERRHHLFAEAPHRGQVLRVVMAPKPVRQSRC